MKVLHGFAPGELNVRGNLVGSKVLPAEPFLWADRSQITKSFEDLSRAVPKYKDRTSASLNEVSTTLTSTNLDK